MRVIVTGCRNWDCFEIAERVIGRLVARYGPVITIVQGGASGVDTAFREAAHDAGLEVSTYPAKWNEEGKGAGPRRNARMVADGADFAIAVHRDLKSSKGTGDCVRRCLAAKIPVWLIDSEDSEPRQITKI